MFAGQQAGIAHWSLKADAAEARRVHHRDVMHEWKQKRFANPYTLAAAFGAGYWWGSSRDFELRPEHHTKLLLGLVNSSLIAWRFLSSPG
jgi:hypothetical protein